MMLKYCSWFTPDHPFSESDSRIIIHTEDLPQIVQDPRCCFDYTHQIIYFLGKKIITYQSKEEFAWLKILA